LKTTAQYLDAAKRKLGIESDYALAPHLGVTKQAISKMRNRPLVMSNTMAAKIAEILEIDLMRVIADMELERGSNDELWKRIAKSVAAGVLVAIGAAIAPPPASAATAAQCGGASDALCIMLNRRRRLLSWLAGLPGFADDDQAAA
jgi:hypothetical protein